MIIIAKRLILWVYSIVLKTVQCWIQPVASFLQLHVKTMLNVIGGISVIYPSSFVFFIVLEITFLIGWRTFSRSQRSII